MQASQREASRQTALRAATPGATAMRNSPSIQQASIPGSPLVQHTTGDAVAAAGSPQIAPGTPANAIAAHFANRPGQPAGTPVPAGGSPALAQAVPHPVAPLQPWEYVDEILGILKTAYPLLSLSMETFVDQIYQRFKCTEDEDAYRLVVALLSDGVQVCWFALFRLY